MPPPSGEDSLADKRLMTVMVRLLLDRDGRLRHGEVIDEAGRLLGRFSAWEGMVATVRKGAPGGGRPDDA